MTTEYNVSAKEWFPFENGKLMVKLKNKEGVHDGGLSKMIPSEPSHLG